MQDQLEYYTETGKYRNRFDQGLPVMAAYTAFRREVYQAGCTRCIQGQTRDAIGAGATKEEVLEAVAVAIVMGGTAVSAETWRVVKVLEELGHKVA